MCLLWSLRCCLCMFQLYWVAWPCFVQWCAVHVLIVCEKNQTFRVWCSFVTKALSSNYVYSQKTINIICVQALSPTQNSLPQIQQDSCQPVFSRDFQMILQKIFFAEVLRFQSVNYFNPFCLWVLLYIFNHNFCFVRVKNCRNNYMFCCAIHFSHCFYVRYRKYIVLVFNTESRIINRLHYAIFVCCETVQCNEQFREQRLKISWTSHCLKLFSGLIISHCQNANHQTMLNHQDRSQGQSISTFCFSSSVKNAIFITWLPSKTLSNFKHFAKH